ncbi:hypothetical protein BH09ACT4_BH09ACT4_16780 [soil metagenome]
MRSRLHHSLRVLPIVVVPLMLLTACNPGGGALPPGGTPADPGGDIPGGPPALVLADTDMMGVTAVATAGNGAVMDIQLVVHAPEPFSADGAADAWAATTAWCAGEIDESAVADNNFSFTTVEVTATTRSGDWPADTPLLMLPLPYEGTTITAGGDLVQTNVSTELGLETGSVPHCAQPVLLTGPGSGQIYLGIASDAVDFEGAPALHGWANVKYGANANQPGDDPAVDVAFSDCTVQITDLGGELGAPTASWQQAFQSDFCVVGGDSVGSDAG